MSELLEHARRIKAARENRDALIMCLSAENLKSRAGEEQLRMAKSNHSMAKFHYCFGGNQSGKTSIMVRELVWMSEETHPYFKRPNSKVCGCGSTDFTKVGEEHLPTFNCNVCGNKWRDWGNGPLTFLLCGEDAKNVDENLWPRVYALLTDKPNWKAIKRGAQLYGYRNSRTGNKILFFYHGQGEEKARKSTQGYTVHAAFLDELPGHRVMEELQQRLARFMGYFKAAFTMKKVNKRVLKFVKGQIGAGVAIEFWLSKLDNPVFAGEREYELAKLAGLTEREKRRSLYGDPGDDEDKVFSVPECIYGKLPKNYSSNWKHVGVLDPAETNKAGVGVFTQDPETLYWHAVMLGYISDIKDPIWLIEQYIKLKNRFDFEMDICDDQAYFVRLAKRDPFNIKFRIPRTKRKKGEGKEALIRNTQTFFNSGRFKVDPDKHSLFWEELDEYEYKRDGSGKISNSHRFHILDVVMYFVDNLPKDTIDSTNGDGGEMTYHQRLRQYNSIDRKNGRRNSRNKKHVTYVIEDIKGIQDAWMPRRGRW